MAKQQAELELMQKQMRPPKYGSHDKGIVVGGKSTGATTGSRLVHRRHQAGCCTILQSIFFDCPHVQDARIFPHAEAIFRRG